MSNVAGENASQKKNLLGFCSPISHTALFGVYIPHKNRAFCGTRREVCR